MSIHKSNEALYSIQSTSEIITFLPGRIQKKDGLSNISHQHPVIPVLTERAENNKFNYI